MRYAVPACAAGALLSLIVLPSAPLHDQWAWIVWGRELLRVSLPAGEIVAKTGLAREPRALLATKDEKGLFIAHAAGSRLSEARIESGTH